MAEEVDPALIEAIMPAIKTTIATVLIGFTLATTLYGISILQIYLYYRAYWKDTMVYKIMVAVLGTIDTFTTILIAHTLYLFAVSWYNEPLTIAGEGPTWSLSLEAVMVDVMIVIAQCFYAHQIWKVSRNIPIIAAIVALSLTGFGMDIWLTVRVFTAPTIESLGEDSMLIPGCVIQGLWALCDFIITGTLIYYLRSMRTTSGGTKTNNLVDKVLLYTVSRGVLTAIGQLTYMAVYIAHPDQTYYIPVHLALAKIYVNSVLATLNVRKNLFAPFEDEPGMRLNTIEKSNAPIYDKDGASVADSRSKTGDSIA